MSNSAIDRLIEEAKQLNFVLTLVIKLRLVMNAFLFKEENRKRASYHKDQRVQYEKLKENFSALYHKVKKYFPKNLVSSYWQNSNNKISRSLLPYPDFDFLKDPKLMYLMFMSSGGELLKSELEYLIKEIEPKFLEQILNDEYFGESMLLSRRYMTSHNSIHHLYHLVRYERQSKRKLSSFNSIIEWGGGYGNLAKIFKRYSRKPITYTIIDLPMFCCLQWLYLSIVFGPEEVHIFTDNKDKIIRRKINIIPLGLIDRQKLNAELFISTWALSESSRRCQEIVKSWKFFGAKHLLLAFHKSTYYLPDSGYTKSILPKKVKVEEINSMKNDYYAFV